MGAPELVAARPATPPVQERCRVLANRVVAPEHNLLTVATREIGRRAQAGQFAQIRVPGGAVFLPRPFSFLAADGDRCMFLSRAIGPGTRALAVLAEGAELELLGPLGHGFDLTVAAAGEVILVGGGVGVPPLVHAAAELAPLTGTALIGAALGEFLLCEQEFAALGWQVRLATDDGSRSHHGFVTELLEQVHWRVVQVRDACSPGGGYHTTARGADTGERPGETGGNNAVVVGAGAVGCFGAQRCSAKGGYDTARKACAGACGRVGREAPHRAGLRSRTPCCIGAPTWRPRPVPPARSPWRSRWRADSASASAAQSACTPPIPTPPRMPWSAATAPSSPLKRLSGKGTARCGRLPWHCSRGRELRSVPLINECRGLSLILYSENKRRVWYGVARYLSPVAAQVPDELTPHVSATILNDRYCCSLQEQCELHANRVN